MTIIHQNLPTIITDRYTNGDRPPQVGDHKGHTWSAVPHGALTPREREQVWGSVPQRFAEDDLVRLQQHSGDLAHIARLTPEGALELAYQLIVSARRARGETEPLPRESVAADAPPALDPLVVLAANFVKERDGHLSLQMSDEGGWIASITFGRESEGEVEVRALAVGTGDTADEALRGALAEAGVQS